MYYPVDSRLIVDFDNVYKYCLSYGSLLIM